MVHTSLDHTLSAGHEPRVEERTRAAATQAESQRESSDVLVLSARQRQSLVAIRSLGQRGLRVAALETPACPAPPAFASRWCHQKIINPTYQDAREELASFQRLLVSTGARVVIPTADSDVALLRRYREQTGNEAGLAIARESALAIAVSKERTLEVAARLGLRVPRGVTLGSVDEVGAAVREIGLPAVVKPDESWLQHERQGVRVASQLVTTAEEARRAVEELTGLGGKVLFQQFLTGRREAVSFLYTRGRVHARFAQWARRTYPPLGGTSILRQSIAVPLDISEQAERLVREIDLEGYAEVEFRRGTSGYPYLMEINPRLSASVEIAVRAGVDFLHLLYQWASGDRVDVVKNYRRGLWMRYLGGDIATTLAALQEQGRPGVDSPARAIFGFCSAFLLPARYDYLDWADPLPAWTALREAQRNGWKRIREHFAKNNLTKTE